jgi:polyhydroxyalkanoate synthesis regulator phasin
LSSVDRFGIIAGMAEPHDDLVDHLVRTTHLPSGVARRVVDDVVAYFSEPAEAVVRRRHRELQAAGLANDAIFDRIAAELAARPVAAPSLTARQIRRVIYG